MKQYYFLLIILVLLLSLALTSCTNNTIDNNSTLTSQETLKGKETLKAGEIYMGNSSVYINGKIVNTFSANIDSTNVTLPFIKTVQALGMLVEIKTYEIVHITYGNDIYILHFSPDIMLVKQGEETDNLMIPPPGTSSYYCKCESNDVFLDTETLSGTLYLMGISIHISIDYTNNKVNITTPLENK